MQKILNFEIFERAPYIKSVSMPLIIELLCASMKKISWCVFQFSGSTCFVLNLMGNGPDDGAITSVLKYKKGL